MKNLAFSVPGYAPVDPPYGARFNGADILGILIWLPTILLSIGLFLAFIFLIYAGFLWITSDGDKQKIESVKKTVGFVIIGLLVIFFSFFILRFVGEYIFGERQIVNMQFVNPPPPAATTVPCRPGDPC